MITMGRRKAQGRGKPKQNQDLLPLSAPLGMLKDELLALQASCSMARGGTTRATATDVADWVSMQYGTAVTPSFVGKVFSSHRFRRTVSHGRPKLVLDLDQLEAARESVCTKLERLVPQVEKDVLGYEDLVQQVTELADRALKVQSLLQRKDSLNRFLADNYTASRHLSILAGNAARLRNQLDQAKLLKRECTELQRKVDALPDLEGPKKSLESSLEEFADEQRIISGKEHELQGRILNLQKRSFWVTIAEMEKAIDDKKKEMDREISKRKLALDEDVRKRKQELKDLDKALAEKRSLADRLLGRRREDGGQA